LRLHPSILPTRPTRSPLPSQTSRLEQEDRRRQESRRGCRCREEVSWGGRRRVQSEEVQMNVCPPPTETFPCRHSLYISPFCFRLLCVIRYLSQSSSSFSSSPTTSSHVVSLSSSTSQLLNSSFLFVVLVSILPPASSFTTPLNMTSESASDTWRLGSARRSVR
jgi:hypothetical protein